MPEALAALVWPLSPLATAWCAVALALGYAVRGVAGFGAGVFAAPLLAFAMPMTTIAPLITVLGLTASVRQAFRGWREIAWKAVSRFVPGTVIGVPLGLWAVKNADQELLIRLLGAYVVGYALWSLFGERLLGRALGIPGWIAYPIGVGGALVATLFGGLAGPLYVTYFDSLGLAKGVFRVTVSTTLLILSVVRSVGYLGAGVFRAEDFMLVGAALVPAGIGTLVGEWVHDRIAPEVFRRCVGGLLALSGSVLLFR
jgi:uncharacterized membrane protein YfcA